MTTVRKQFALVAALLTLGAGGAAAQAPASPAAAPAATPAASSWLGDWVWSASSQGTVVAEGTMRLVRNGSVWAGSVVMPQGEVQLQSVTVEGRTVRFVMPGQNGVIRAEGELDSGGVLRGTWSDEGGGSGNWTASKR